MTKALANPKLFAAATILFAIATFANLASSPEGATSDVSFRTSPATIATPSPATIQTAAR
jgi:hypothetical protein